MSDQLNFFGESDESLEYKPYYMMDVEISSSKKLFTVISTFSGGGGSSLGYKLAGGDCKFGIPYSIGRPDKGAR